MLVSLQLHECFSTMSTYVKTSFYETLSGGDCTTPSGTSIDKESPKCGNKTGDFSSKCNNKLESCFSLGEQSLKFCYVIAKNSGNTNLSELRDRVILISCSILSFKKVVNESHDEIICNSVHRLFESSKKLNSDCAQLYSEHMQWVNHQTTIGISKQFKDIASFVKQYLEGNASLIKDNGTAMRKRKEIQSSQEQSHKLHKSLSL